MLHYWFDFIYVLLPCSKQNPGWVSSGVLMYLLFLGIVQNNTKKLDNALIHKVRCVWGCIFSDIRMWFFPASYPGVPLKRDHWLSKFSASAPIKFQIGIVSFSLCLLCHILVHHLGWKESRIWKTSRGVKVWFRPWLSGLAPAFILVCVLLCSDQ